MKHKTIYMAPVIILMLNGAITTLPIRAENVKNIEDISQEKCEQMKKTGVIKQNTPITCKRLKTVTFKYINFQNKIHHNGKLIVLDAVAPYVKKITKALYQKKFLINKAIPMEHYKGNDDKSMRDNNSAAFNGRVIQGEKNILSLHAYGLAIDVNPIQNPFIKTKQDGKAIVKPNEGAKYLNRKKIRYGKKIRKQQAEDIIDIFAENGFQYWGGFWDNPIDYQHFQTSREMAELMVEMKPEDARLFFEKYTIWYQKCREKFPEQYKKYQFNDYAQYLKKQLNTKSLKKIYQNQKIKIMHKINQNIKTSNLCIAQP